MKLINELGRNPWDEIIAAIPSVIQEDPSLLFEKNLMGWGLLERACRSSQGPEAAPVIAEFWAAHRDRCPPGEYQGLIDQALVLAANQHDSPTLIKTLLNCGAGPNAQRTSWLHTALHTALLNNRRSAARVLLEAGARTDLLDRKGRSPLDLAGVSGVAQLHERFTGEPGPGDAAQDTITLRLAKSWEASAEIAQAALARQQRPLADGADSLSAAADCESAALETERLLARLENRRAATPMTPSPEGPPSTP